MKIVIDGRLVAVTRTREEVSCSEAVSDHLSKDHSTTKSCKHKVVFFPLLASSFATHMPGSTHLCYRHIASLSDVVLL